MIGEFGYKEKEISIGNGLLVQVPIVLKHSFGSVFLGYEENGGGLGRLELLDVFFVKMFLKPFFYLLLFVMFVVS